MFRKYWEAGFSVIPVIGKRAIIDGWQQYNNRLATEEEIEHWEKTFPFPKFGVGLCPGPASNLVLLDCDTESPDIKSIIPPSPVVRFGAKGGCYIYKYNSEIQSSKCWRDNLGPNKNIYKHEGVEIFSNSGQVVMPPSIHPDTNNPYIWLTLDTLENYSVNDLPTLNKREIEDIFSYIKQFPYTDEHGRKHNNEEFSVGSRNGKLTQIICAIISNGSNKTNEEIAKEIYDHDQREFGNKSYFHDDTRQHNKKAKGNASLAALYFTKEHRSRMIKKGFASEYKKIESINIEEIISPQKKSEFPESSGLIKTIQNYILRVSRSKQDELALGGSIAILSALCSNRFHIDGKPAITHQYIMNVARSGQGKGAGFYITSKLFGPGVLEKYNLLGLRNYSSIAAFVEMLPSQRSRLDMIDEFGTMLEAFSNGSQISKEVESLLTEFYTNRGDYWRGHFTKMNGFKGGCFSPAVTVYANIQEKTLIDSAKESMINSGLLSRFLYFSGKNDCEFNPNYSDNIDVSDLSNECARIFPFHRLEPTLSDGSVLLDQGKIEPYREPLILPNEVKDYKTNIDRDLYNKEIEMERQDNVKGAIFLSRFLQIAERIAIVNAVCCDRREIIKDDYDYGIAVVRASQRQSIDYLSSIGNSRTEKKISWAKRIIKKSGFITHSKLLKNSHLDSGEFKKLINTMIESGIVQEVKDAKTDAKGYRICE